MTEYCILFVCLFVFLYTVKKNTLHFCRITQTPTQIRAKGPRFEINSFYRLSILKKTLKKYAEYWPIIGRPPTSAPHFIAHTLLMLLFLSDILFLRIKRAIWAPKQHPCHRGLTYWIQSTCRCAAGPCGSIGQMWLLHDLTLLQHFECEVFSITPALVRRSLFLPLTYFFLSRAEAMDSFFFFYSITPSLSWFQSHVRGIPAGECMWYIDIYIYIYRCWCSGTVLKRWGRHVWQRIITVYIDDTDYTIIQIIIIIFTEMFRRYWDCQSCMKATGRLKNLKHVQLLSCGFL